MQCSSHIPKPSTHSAEASGIGQLSVVQCATIESIASKTHLDEQRQFQCYSHAISQGGTIPRNSPTPLNPEDLAKIAYKAADELSEAQTASILEQLYGDSFEWGLSVDIKVTTSPEEPCSLAEALASPDAPKWLATCNEELASIKDLKVFHLVPHNAATGRTIMDGKFVFRLTAIFRIIQNYDFLRAHTGPFGKTSEDSAYYKDVLARLRVQSTVTANFYFIYLSIIRYSKNLLTYQQYNHIFRIIFVALFLPVLIIFSVHTPASLEYIQT